MTGTEISAESEQINRLRTRVMPDRKGWLSTLVWNLRDSYLAWPEDKTDNRSVRWVVEGFLEEIRDLERVRQDLIDWRNVALLSEDPAERAAARVANSILNGTYQRHTPADD